MGYTQNPPVSLKGEIVATGPISVNLEVTETGKYTISETLEQGRDLPAKHTIYANIKEPMRLIAGENLVVFTKGIAVVTPSADA